MTSLMAAAIAAAYSRGRSLDGAAGAVTCSGVRPRRSRRTSSESGAHGFRHLQLTRCSRGCTNGTTHAVADQEPPQSALSSCSGGACMVLRTDNEQWDSLWIPAWSA